MNISIHIGSWAYPMILTIIVFLWASWVDHNDNDCLRIAGFFAFAAAIIVSLIGWLVWALLTRS